METQLTLAMMNDELGQARTSKKEFLEKFKASYRGIDSKKSLRRAITKESAEINRIHWN